MRPFRRRARPAAAGVEKPERLEALALPLLGTSGPVIAGPWLGEIGIEVLYWIPLLRLLVERWPELGERLVAVSRGGVALWYEGIAASYLDVGELCDADAYLARVVAEREARRARGEHYGKQVGETAWEREIVAHVRRRLAAPDAPVLHPAAIFPTRKLVAGQAASLYRPWRVPERGALDGLLPPRYAAVRFYRNGPFKGAKAARFASEATSALAERIPVVLIQPEVAFDPDHHDFPHDGDVTVLSSPLRTVHDNLALQSAALAHAAAFVGTFGGFSFLPPHLGVPTFAFWSIDRLRKNEEVDLRLAEEHFNRPGWGGFRGRSAWSRLVAKLLEPVFAAVG